MIPSAGKLKKHIDQLTIVALVDMITSMIYKSYIVLKLTCLGTDINAEMDFKVYILAVGVARSN